MATESQPSAAAAITPDQPPPPSATTSLGRSPYPYAYAPDIIRAHQKDAYFQGLLTNQLSDLHRQLLGARSAHAWASESRTLADLLYLSLTTLLGNRTLGEEYCGLVQVEDDSDGQLPSLPRRAAYIAGSILLPYGLNKILPAFRGSLRKALERSLARMSAKANSSSAGDGTNKKPKTPIERTWRYRFQSYVLANLSSLTSPAPIHAASLTLFYFSGSYYEIAKRLAGLRYIFTHKVGESSDRAGYEVLGVLLVVQMLVQGYLHVRSTLLQPSSSSSGSSSGGGGARSVEVSLDEHAYSSNNSLLYNSNNSNAQGGGGGNGNNRAMSLAQATHTPFAPPGISDGGSSLGDVALHHDLSNPSVMRWVGGAQQRKCTLCLEELKDPALTGCGHVFCWVCVGDWVREKPECPLCRREVMVQHILPLRCAS